MAVLLGVERLRKWPKFAFHGGTAALHRESQPPCRRAIMGQLSIGVGFHTFLRRAGNIRMLINRGRGYQNLRYLLLKAKRLAVSNTEFIALTSVKKVA